MFSNYRPLLYCGSSCIILLFISCLTFFLSSVINGVWFLCFHASVKSETCVIIQGSVAKNGWQSPQMPYYKPLDIKQIFLNVVELLASEYVICALSLSFVKLPPIWIRCHIIISAIRVRSPNWNIRHFELDHIMNLQYYCNLVIHCIAIESFLMARCCIPDLFLLTVNYACFETILIW